MRRKFLYGTPLEPPRAGTMASRERSGDVVDSGMGRVAAVGWLTGASTSLSGRLLRGGEGALVLLAVLVPDVGVVAVLAAREPGAAGRVVQQPGRPRHVVEDVVVLGDVADALVRHALEA